MNLLGVSQAKRFRTGFFRDFVSDTRRLACQLALLVLAPAFAWSQIALVNVTTCGPQNFPSACTIPATGSGNLIVVGFMSGVSNTGNTISSIGDTGGNSYAEAGAARASDTGVPDVIDLWYARNSRSGTSSVTVTPSAAVNGCVVIWEFSGVDQTAPLDRTSVLNNQAATTNVSGAPVTTTAPSELIISIANVQQALTGIAGGNPFMNDSNAFSSGWAHLITSAAGTYTAQWNQDTAGTYDSSTVSFKAASGGNTSSGTTSAGGSSAGAPGACDVNKDGTANVVDVQVATNNSLSCPAAPAFSTFVNQVITGALGSCPVTSGLHTIAVTWGASSTGGVTYNIYRATSSGGYNYSSPLNSTPISGTSFVDCTAALGQTYYYVIRAVDGSGNQSVSSAETVASVPAS